jgi:hypothetical protein
MGFSSRTEMGVTKYIEVKVLECVCVLSSFDPVERGSEKLQIPKTKRK